MLCSNYIMMDGSGMLFQYAVKYATQSTKLPASNAMVAVGMHWTTLESAYMQVIFINSQCLIVQRCIN